MVCGWLWGDEALLCPSIQIASRAMAQVGHDRLSSPRFAWNCEDLEDEEERDVMPAPAPRPVVLQLSHAKSWHLDDSDTSPPSPRWGRKAASKVHPEVVLSSGTTDRSSSIVSLPSHYTDDDGMGGDLWPESPEVIRREPSKNAAAAAAQRPPSASTSSTMEVSTTTTPNASRTTLGRLLRTTFNRPATASPSKHATRLDLENSRLHEGERYAHPNR